RGVLQLDADRPVDAQRLDLPQVGGEVHDASAGRQVAMDLTVAVAEMNVDRLAAQPAHLLGTRSGQYEVGDIDVRLDGWMIHVVEEPDHALDVVEHGQLERLQFEGDLQVEIGRVLGQLAHVAHARPPLLGRSDYLSFPNVLAENEQQVAGLVFVREVEVRPAALQMEALDTRVEIDESKGHARHTDDGQPHPVALVLDQAPLAGAQIERIGEDVDRVEADFASHTDAK